MLTDQHSELSSSSSVNQLLSTNRSVINHLSLHDCLGRVLASVVADREAPRESLSILGDDQAGIWTQSNIFADDVFCLTIWTNT